MLFSLRSSKTVVFYHLVSKSIIHDTLKRSTIPVTFTKYQKIGHDIGEAKSFHSCAACCARKPRWLPIAPSKMFKIIEKPLLPKDEEEEIEYNNKNYQTLMSSLVDLQQRIDTENITKYNLKVGSAEKEISELIAKNEINNVEVAKRRNELQELEWSKIENEILNARAIKEKEDEERLKEQEKFIQAEILRLNTAIKIEDLDDVIAKALGNVTDYNFSIDGKGKFYPGRHNVHKSNEMENVNINQFSLEVAS